MSEAPRDASTEGGDGVKFWVIVHEEVRCLTAVHETAKFYYTNAPEYGAGRRRPYQKRLTFETQDEAMRFLVQEKAEVVARARAHLEKLEAELREIQEAVMT